MISLSSTTTQIAFWIQFQAYMTRYPNLGLWGGGSADLVSACTHALYGKSLLGADHLTLEGGGGWFWKKISCKRLSEEKNCMQHKCNKELMGKKGKKNILPTILLEKKILDDQKSPTPTLKS